MLVSLHIKNFTLIEESIFKPGNGFTTITGETGAGKSILLDALGLTLGSRADLKSIEGAKAVIETTFNIEKLGLNNWFLNADLDFDVILRMRREITKDGKSRAFINDTPTTLNLLKELGDKLLEIHTQNSSYDFKSSINKLGILDDYAQNKSILNDYLEIFYSLKNAKKELDSIAILIANNLKEKDYTLYLIQEFEVLNLNLLTDIGIENQLDMLNSADEIKQVCSKIEFVLQANEHSIVEQITELKQDLKSYTNLNVSLENISNRLIQCVEELKDIANEAFIVVEKSDINPADLENLNARFNQIQNLYRKHQVNSVEELLHIYENLNATAFEGLNLEKTQLDLTVQIEKLTKNAIVLAKELHVTRTKAGKELAKILTEELFKLEIENAQCDFVLEFNENLLSNLGASQVQFMFSANAGKAMQNIESNASGGEMSRVYFCLRSILASKVNLPTLIFDEADTGVSGQVATRMGNVMKQMGDLHQIIAITHLPQVASKGTNHFHVKKETIENKTFSSIQQLNIAERKVIIAEMIQGKNPDSASLQAAENLLKN